MAIVRLTPGLAQAAVDATDWAAQDALTDDDIRRQVAGNPDAAPMLTDGATAAALVQSVCLELKLSQAEFAGRYGIPLRTLTNWAQDIEPPSQAVFNYLRVIAREPEIVGRALQPA